MRASRIWNRAVGGLAGNRAAARSARFGAVVSTTDRDPMARAGFDRAEITSARFGALPPYRPRRAPIGRASAGFPAAEFSRRSRSAEFRFQKATLNQPEPTRPLVPDSDGHDSTEGRKS